MKKNLKKIFVWTMLLTMLSAGAGYCTETEVQEPNQVTNVLPVRQPTSKRALAMKFVMAMLGVGASSVAIFVTLSLYNRLMYGTVKRKDERDSEDNDFKTSTNMKEALGIFLKKTK